MTAPSYLRALALCLAIWLGLFLALTCTIDPYGVSPIQLSLRKINAFKPKRVHIDRLIKPYEVWRYQPRTVFLGTSRFHESMDPSILDGTQLSPAYNASIPNASLSMNIDYLQQYVHLNPNMRTVVVELFVDNFLSARGPPEPKTWAEFAANAIKLFASSDTLWDSIATLAHNALNGRPTYEIKPGGHFYYPPGHEAQGRFDGFSAWIWKPHYQEPYKMAFYQFDSIREIISIARAHKLEVIFVATPNHAYVDYYYDVVGAWGPIEEWLTQLSRLAPVYSFSQPNSWVYEPVSTHMTYWHDPHHFSLMMGRGMLATLAGLPVSGLPDNFMERLTPERVAVHVDSRRQGVRQWARENPGFVRSFEEARQKWLATKTKTQQD